MTKPLFILLLLAFFSCTNEKTQGVNEPKPKNTSKGENFDSFYFKFHTDSLFQMERIRFPLKGYFRDGFQNPDSVKSVFYWQKEKWIMHHLFNDQNGMYRQQFTKNDTMIVDKVFVENSGFSIERKFKIIDGKWFMTYYSHVNL